MLELICKELGVEVGEKWLANDGLKYRITSRGFLEKMGYSDALAGDVVFTDDIKRLLVGELKPIWKPKNGVQYYYSKIDCVSKFGEKWWSESITDVYRFGKGLIFKTKEEAIEATNKMLEVLKHD